MMSFEEFLTESSGKTVHVSFNRKMTGADKKAFEVVLKRYDGKHKGDTDKGATFEFPDHIDAKLFSQAVNGNDTTIKSLAYAKVD